MYIREKVRRLLNIKNVLLVAFSVFMIFSSVAYIISEIAYYRDDLETAMSAVSMEECIMWSIVCPIILVYVGLSRKYIYFANFCSSYFEGDLDGYVEYEDLAEVVGISPQRVRLRLVFVRTYLMKNFELKKVDGKEQIVLASKVSLCSCNHCGAPIEKRVFFTGKCPYCGGSDLHAKVFTNNKFYNISSDFSSGIKNPKHYVDKNLNVKRALFITLLAVNLFFLIILFFMTIGDIDHYFDKEYQKSLLLSPDYPYKSYKLIKGEILSTIVYDVVFLVVFTPLAVLRMRKISSVNHADECSAKISRFDKPFIDAKAIVPAEKSKKYLKKVRQAIKYRYLRNCTLEMHNHNLKIALSKKVVKDQCPTCGASITGAVDQDYVCKYCGNKIKDVVVKK